MYFWGEDMEKNGFVRFDSWGGICLLDTFWLKIWGEVQRFFVSLPSNGDHDPT